MSHNETVSAHYSHGSLLDSIREAITQLGKTTASVTIEDLAPVDEFHIGGRVATQNLLDQLGFLEAGHVLDVGCGLGGASRFAADRYGGQVTGIDLTQEYVDTGNALCAWLEMDRDISLLQGSALDMPFEDATFDGAYMIHVGMNIEDKARLFAEVHRVLRPGASFGVYDVMRSKPGELAYPVPWAARADTSLLSTAEQYDQALKGAGFETSAPNNRRNFAVDFFATLRTKAEAAESPPPLGLHTLMQASTATKVQNMLDNIANGLVAPVELIARKQ